MKPGECCGVAEMSTLLHRYNKVGFRVAIKELMCNKVWFRVAIKVLMCRVLYRLGRCCKALIIIEIGVGLRRLRYG